REGVIEREHLRPILRGEGFIPWRASARGEAIVWPLDTFGATLSRLPDDLAKWLAPWRRRLAVRSDVRGRARWWSVFRTEGAANDRPRVVWPDVARVPRAAVLDAGDPIVPLNSCYIVRAPTLEDALALAALLNAPVTGAWLRLLAEPARGSYARL